MINRDALEYVVENLSAQKRKDALQAMFKHLSKCKSKSRKFDIAGFSKQPWTAPTKKIVASLLTDNRFSSAFLTEVATNIADDIEQTETYSREKILTSVTKENYIEMCAIVTYFEGDNAIEVINEINNKVKSSECDKEDCGRLTEKDATIHRLENEKDILIERANAAEKEKEKNAQTYQSKIKRITEQHSKEASKLNLEINKLQQMCEEREAELKEMTSKYKDISERYDELLTKYTSLTRDLEDVRNECFELKEKNKKEILVFSDPFSIPNTIMAIVKFVGPNAEVNIDMYDKIYAVTSNLTYYDVLQIKKQVGPRIIIKQYPQQVVDDISRRED